MKKVLPEEILNILNKKKLQLIFLFYILLILPILCPIAQNLDFWHVVLIIVVNGILFISLALLSLFCSSKAEKIISTVILIVSIIPSAIFLSYLLFARVMLETYSITSLFETNPDESKEFLTDYLSIWVIIAVLIYVAIPAVMIWKMKAFKPLKIKGHKVLFSVPFILLILIFAGQKLSQSVYIFSFYKTFCTYKLRLGYEEKTISSRHTISYPVEIANTDSIPQTIVVVIGESLTRNHMSLYGYPRQTNPLLSKRKDKLYVYEDVTPPQVHTIPVVRTLFTMMDEENPDYFTEKPSVFELFNRAGYDTYFMSNQPFGGKFRTSYDVLLDIAKNRYQLSQKKQHDEVILPTLKEILENKDNSSKNKLIIIQLLGSHMAYKKRYPENFKLFDHTKDGLVANAEYRDQEAKNMIDEYDNSVAYNDFVINSIIDNLEQKGGEKSVLIYFSDHGEELYDKRKFAGHAYEKVSRYMCQIPFMVWVSDKYKETNPEIVFNTKLPYSTTGFIYGLSDVAGLRYMDYDAEKSMFSPQFKPETRYIGKLTYEEVLERE
ncbi:sulfatase-like hydrolase/transferase [Dysgonomonas sp. 520]|uniref:sulfatase-like hydrolase/transferase n=1 Tax=Dysgonomonas sp. 520 TaxID=2302931 RepID=UPI0013D630D6|nr:sulfatase-like hydrolase/transferase [Dysgonomonas sp. 520]NDW09444.1 DUF1705 domain-containing protein [Dysgonomonas sp. 520]